MPVVVDVDALEDCPIGGVPVLCEAEGGGIGLGAHLTIPFDQDRPASRSRRQQLREQPLRYRRTMSQPPVPPEVPDSTALPVLFFDRPVSEPVAALLVGRALTSGPDPADLADSDGAIIGATQLWNAETVAASPRLRVVSRTGIGYDNVDVGSLASVGVTVCNAPEAPSVSTAEHTLMLMLALTKHLDANVARARAGDAGAATSNSLELDGRTLGLVGFGRIARRVAASAGAMGMRVIAYDPFVADNTTGVGMVPLDRIWADSDVVSLHAPATADTRHLICTHTIAAMRPGAYLVNCARGALVDQEALLAALDNGHLGGAALDVTEPEPLPVGHPLLSHPRVIVTPHCASSTGAGRVRLFAHAIDNALGVLTGGPATVVRP